MFIKKGSEQCLILIRQKQPARWKWSWSKFRKTEDKQKNWPSGNIRVKLLILRKIKQSQRRGSVWRVLQNALG